MKKTPKPKSKNQIEEERIKKVIQPILNSLTDKILEDKPKDIVRYTLKIF